MWCTQKKKRKKRNNKGKWRPFIRPSSPCPLTGMTSDRNASGSSFSAFLRTLGSTRLTNKCCRMASVARGRTRSEVLGLYKNLMKEVSTHITPLTQNTTFRDYIREEFRSNRPSDESESGYQAALAYYHLLKSSHNHEYLLHTYEIGLQSIDQRRAIAKNAATVGVKLPKWSIDSSESSPADRYKGGLEGARNWKEGGVPK